MRTSATCARRCRSCRWRMRRRRRAPLRQRRREQRAVGRGQSSLSLTPQSARRRVPRSGRHQAPDRRLCPLPSALCRYTAPPRAAPGTPAVGSPSAPGRLANGDLRTPIQRDRRQLPLTDFLIDYGIVVALVCAGAAVVYGALTSRYLLAKSPGNERMQEISKAVQEGASAYLKRQYTIIGGVAVILAIVLAIALDVRTAVGFLIGGAFSAAAGFIGMNVSVRANARVAESARGGISPALDSAFKG